LFFIKKPQGKCRREDPELSGAISVLDLIKDKEKRGGRVQSSQYQFPVPISLLHLIRNNRHNQEKVGGRVSLLFVYNKQQ